ncbi:MULTISPECIES: DUF4124 domain-containing protein [Geobacter]|uniref:DUF4124 domain-containing protein n=1 Tax=Geobacter TaxID=28231 RepID=UPI002572DBD7|nr:DUF4124 domain-containing protein [Geobacter sulfurreducens]BEH10010.1 DUF4124 domain-containing protein [Geobacter sulfurreducens subsp. ethanolicus]BET58401.1 DUF4124 domain-containing protein [Geobacter sp. 60473]HML77983.1 DUF4124 domain-containing protein [Geobacter sulfurreducens]
MIRTCTGFAVIAVLSLPGAVLAETYQWTDDAGVVHFTDNLERIPSKYLKRVKELPSVRGETPSSPSMESPAAPAEVKPALKPQSPILYGGLDERGWRTRFSSLREELKVIEESLPKKREELNQLHRRWVISMGRVPSQGELKDFAEKQAEGSATVEDNPYVNKSALSTPGRHREAYYAKLQEVRQEEARVGEIKKQLEDLELEASRVGVPFEWRR